MKRTIHIYTIAIALFVMSAVNVMAQVSNGNFESWSGDVPNGWTTIDEGVTLMEENGTVHGGSSSASVNVTTGTQGDTDIRQTISVVSGTTYNISFWAYHTEGGMRVRLYAGDYFNYTDPEMTNSWQELTYELLAETSGDIEVGLRFYDLAEFDGEEIVYIDDFVVEEQVITGPTLTITSPAEGATVQSDEINVSFITQNFVIGEPGQSGIDGYIFYTNEGSSDDHYTSDPLNISGLSDGDYTLIMELRDEFGAALNPAVIDTLNYTISIPSTTTVNSVAELRAGTIGEFYTLTAEVSLTYQQDFRNQKFIQDGTGGILIDDTDGTITTQYQIDNGITGITGELGEFGGMMQFVPIADPGPASTVNFPADIVEISLMDLTNDFEAYESELVLIPMVSFDDGGTFENGTVYPISDPSGSYNFRTTFYNVDYIGTEIPSELYYIGIPNSREDGDYFTPRNLADFLLVGVDELALLNLSVYPNPTTEMFYIENGDQVFSGSMTITDLHGKTISSQNVNLSNGSRLMVDCSDYNAGMYFINITNDENKSNTTMTVIVR